jgi:hypothetical protein
MDDPLDLCFLSRFKDIFRAFGIDFEKLFLVDARSPQGGRQVKKDIYALEHFLQRVGLSYISMENPVSLWQQQIPLADECADLPFPPEELLSEMRPDESRGSCDECFHGLRIRC